MRIVKIIVLVFITLEVFPQTQSERLEEAYRKKSKEDLKIFFDTWGSEFKFIDYSDSSELKKTAAEIYKLFYNPVNVTDIGLNDEYWNPSWVKYFIIQNDIYVFQLLGDSLESDFHSEPKDENCFVKDSIMSFRPEIKINEITPLYLTDEYKEILLDFLGDKHTPLGYKGLMNPAGSSGRSLKKQEFLNDQVLIIYGHWGGYWHLETHPYVYSITLNRAKNQAVVKYRLGYQGGDAFFVLIDNKWYFKSGSLTWIE